SAMDLNRLVRRLDRDFACEIFCHRRLQDDLFSLVLHRSGAVCEQARRFDLRRHVCKLPLDRLKFSDWFAELYALARVFYAGVQSPLPDAERQCGDADAAAVEDRKRLRETRA